MKRKQRSIYVEDSLWEKLLKMRRGWTKSGFIRYLIKKEWRNKILLENS